MVLKKSTPGKFVYTCHFQQTGISATKVEKTGIHFKTDVFLQLPLSVLKLPNIYTHKCWRLLGYGKKGKKTCRYVFELESDTAHFTTIKSGLSCLLHLRECHLFIMDKIHVRDLSEISGGGRGVGILNLGSEIR